MERPGKLSDALRQFWLRDYRKDVRLLNERIKRRGLQSAGLEDVPPSVLTGDPLALTPGQCIMVVGKNPSFPGQAGDVEAAREEHADAAWERHYARRRLFFADEDPNHQYNWTHFSRFGNLLRSHVSAVSGATAKQAFRTSIAVFDVLPWWSKDTSGIDPHLLSDEIEPVAAWKEVLGQAFRALEPTLVIVHGSGFLQQAEAVLETRLTRFDFVSPTGYVGVAYSGRSACGIRILAHAQVTAKGGPGTADAYGALIRAWPLGSQT